MMKPRFLLFFALLAVLLMSVGCQSLLSGKNGKTTTHAKVLPPPTVRIVATTPHDPWDGMIDITFYLDGTPRTDLYYVKFSGLDEDHGHSVEMNALSGDGVNKEVTIGGPYTATWNYSADFPMGYPYKLTFMGAPTGRYLVINLETGEKHYSSSAPNIADDTCRSTELWLRKIPAGAYIMGSPEEELGRNPNENQHVVTLTHEFYIGIFEITRRQYELITDKSSFQMLMNNIYKGDYYSYLPATQITYDAIRGASTGAGWPASSEVERNSFLGQLRAKTGMTSFDLPTEAQWEYACRGTTSTALNSGKEILTPSGTDGNLNEVGWYWGNTNSELNQSGIIAAPVKVGSFVPNQWGLYDMHGNVWEWCLDWYQEDLGETPVVDPRGNATGVRRVGRGGCWNTEPRECRSAVRRGFPTTSTDEIGFRVICLP